jgi:hypothetical protein
MNSFGSGYGQIEGSGSMKSGELLDKLSDC